ncbi:unnamed protein product [Paramecium primaurelia]|uniref:Uncharacterized protein n=1 Tax=Paramecium primaurelia TaxID=5886 RepID=A0A8S1N9F7_PARPR|nr:unnamed protein product [Paramecium primaurelia]
MVKFGQQFVPQMIVIQLLKSYNYNNQDISIKVLKLPHKSLILDYNTLMLNRVPNLNMESNYISYINSDYYIQAKKKFKKLYEVYENLALSEDKVETEKIINQNVYQNQWSQLYIKVFILLLKQKNYLDIQDIIKKKRVTTNILKPKTVKLGSQNDIQEDGEKMMKYIPSLSIFKKRQFSQEITINFD